MLFSVAAAAAVYSNRIRSANTRFCDASVWRSEIRDKKSFAPLYKHWASSCITHSNLSRMPFYDASASFGNASPFAYASTQLYRTMSAAMARRRWHTSNYMQSSGTRICTLLLSFCHRRRNEQHGLRIRIRKWWFSLKCNCFDGVCVRGARAKCANCNGKHISLHRGGTSNLQFHFVWTIAGRRRNANGRFVSNGWPQKVLVSVSLTLTMFTGNHYRTHSLLAIPIHSHSCSADSLSSFNGQVVVVSMRNVF